MIRLDQEGGLWTVTLDRPDKRNALTQDMLAQLCEIAEGARGARVLVLTGAGPVFSAGADLAAAKAGLATSPLWERLSGAIADLPGLTIAALNGTCAGGAMGMVLACDFRVAVPQAAFFYPVMKLGFLPQPSDPERLAHLVGAPRARQVFLGGRKVDAVQAAEWGLVDLVAEGPDLAAEVQQLAADALAATPAHVAAIKALCP